LLPLGLGAAPGLALAGGPLRFGHVAVLVRGAPAQVVAAESLDPAVLAPLLAPRATIAGLVSHRTAVMGIVNVTPDSFSDGGRNAAPETAIAAAQAQWAAGADIVDFGAESTRPGAAAVDAASELARLAAVLPALAGRFWSIDTRKAVVMAAALDAGAALVNDVSALGHDPAALALVAERGCPVVLMHAQGEPATMQAAPAYDDVLLDVYDWLGARIDACVAAGIDRARIIVDPGIGFGKTLAHNLALLRGLALFHGLGVPVLLGASRKAVVARITQAAGLGDAGPEHRLPGSLALALHAASCGVQVVRVHDVVETVQALAVWHSARGIDA
jgi:dihydropteroate synthase